MLTLQTLTLVSQNSTHRSGNPIKHCSGFRYFSNTQSMFSPAIILDSADLLAVRLRNSQSSVPARHNSPSTFPTCRTLNFKQVHRNTRIHGSNDSNQPTIEESMEEQPQTSSGFITYQEESAAEQPQTSSGFTTYQEEMPQTSSGFTTYQEESAAEQPQTSSAFTTYQGEMPQTSSGFTTYQEESVAEQPQTSSGFTNYQEEQPQTSSGFTTYQEESAAEQPQMSSGFTTYQISSGFTTYQEESAAVQPQTPSGFTAFQEDPLVDKLRTQLGVIHPLPSPPVNRNIVGFFIFFFLFGVVFDKLWMSRKRSDSARDAQPGTWPQVPTSFSLFLEKDLRRKESVEWVNMVLGKLWKVYRSGIENWIIGSLQPVIDNLKKPEYVQRVEIKQFSLGDEPLSVRNVERKTSRRDNDLQYQIGLRYTGGARMLLSLSLKFGIIPIVVPVRVRDFDIDGELWVKLRLVPSQPWVGAASWAFVSLPKIKFELSPFRLFNLMAIPVLSMFLTKLLTEDLPRQFVRPKKIVLDFQKGKAVGPISDDFKTDAVHEGNKDFVGELSVTLVDARKLAYVQFGKTDPYVVLRLGDQVIYSKKNSQTTVIGPPGEPIWNQDFHLLVANPRKQKLYIQVKDSFGFNDFTVGTGEIGLGSLQDTVPTDKIVALKGRWGLFMQRSSGEILLRLTYKAYVEDEEEDGVKIEYVTTNISKDEMLDSEQVIGASGESKSGYSDRESFMDVLAALIVSEEFQGIVSSETGSSKVAEEFKYPESAAPEDRELNPKFLEPASMTGGRSGNTYSALVWLAVITSISVLIAINVGGSSDFNP